MSDHDQDNPIRAMRARRAAEEAARREARRNELGPDPFGDDEVADIIEDTIDQQIWKLSRPGGDGTWMSVTHLLNRVLKLVEFKMGRTGSDEPVISLIISADEAHDMMNQIRDAIGPQDPDPLPWDGD